MQDMLKTIIAMDEKARQSKLQAQQDKAEIEQEIEVTKEQIHNEYTENAKQKIENIIKNEQKKADKVWEESKKRDDAAMARLKDDFARNKDKWVSEIVSNALK